jgi:hypothetical protein
VSPVGLAAALRLGSTILAAAAIDLDRDAHLSAIPATSAIFPFPLSS